MSETSQSYPDITVARRPEDCNRILLAALEAGDLETCVALYEPGAVLFKKSGETMLGLEAIRQNYAALIALKPRFSISLLKATVSGDGEIATNRMTAKLTATRADGQPIEGENSTLEVVRKQADGSWRYIIDDPYGSMRASMRER